MTAKEFLGQIKQIESMIKQKRRTLEEMRQSAIGGGSCSGFNEKVQHSISGDRMGRAVDEYVDLEREIERDVLCYWKKKNEIINVIHSLKDDRYIRILYAKWVEDKRLEEIAVEMNYYFGTIRKLYWKAMRDIEKRIEKETKL